MRTSLLAEGWCRAGGEARRVGLPDCDVREISDARGVGELIGQSSGAVRAVVLWGSLPCGHWTAFRRFAKNGARRAFDRAGGPRVIKLSKGQARRVIERGALVAFEWLANGRGWKEDGAVGLQETPRASATLTAVPASS